MAHFAEIDAKGIVLRVIVAEQSFIDSGRVGNPKNWVQTSYNTYEGKHTKGGEPLRKNYAGIGFTYDKTRDAFIPPKRYDSFVFDEKTATYKAPVDKPIDGKEYKWNEQLTSWEQEQ